MNEIKLPSASVLLLQYRNIVVAIILFEIIKLILRFTLREQRVLHQFGIALTTKRKAG